MPICLVHACAQRRAADAANEILSTSVYLINKTEVCTPGEAISALMCEWSSDTTRMEDVLNSPVSLSRQLFS